LRRAARPYSRCVFVNCPFDKTFKPLLDAILFAIHDCGFIARIALEEAGTGDARLERIREIIEESRFSIHDVSRVQQSRAQPLPRFNMAFECGVFFGAKFFGAKVHRTKDLLVLDKLEHRFKATVSDLGGQDGSHHNDDPNAAINCVRVFLARKSEYENIPGAAYIQKRFRLFKAQLPAMAKIAKLSLRELQGLDYLPELLHLMIAWQKRVDRLAKTTRRGPLRRAR
jgi:hypothetical protein